MKSFFTDKLQYNHQANVQFIELVLKNAFAYENQVAALFSHILNAHTIWNNRIMRKPDSVGVWDILLLQDLTSVNEANWHESLDLINKIDLEETIVYTNTKGVSFSNTVSEILYHVINHSTYHRGQLIRELKQQGIAPISTDYIFYKRQ